MTVSSCITVSAAGSDSWKAKVIDEVAPAEDDIIIRKTAFGPGNLDYVLRNMGLSYLVVSAC